MPQRFFILAAVLLAPLAMLFTGCTLFRIDEKLTRDETWPAAFGGGDQRT